MTLTEPPVPETAPAPKKRCCWMKKFCGWLFVLAAIAAVAAFYFCPIFMPARPVPATDTSGIETQIGDIHTRMQALENRIAALETRSATPAPAPAAVTNTTSASATDLARLQSEYAALSSALTALQAEVKQAESATSQSQQATHALLASAIAFIQLRDEASSGHDFAAPLAQLRAASSTDASAQSTLVSLEPYAASGAPTLATLREELDELEPAVANAALRAQAKNWWQRILAELKGLVSIRPLHGGEGGDFAAIEDALARGDAAAALEAIGKLPPEAQDSLADWRKKLEARQTIDAALTALAAHFTAVPARGTP